MSHVVITCKLNYQLYSCDTLHAWAH